MGYVVGLLLSLAVAVFAIVLGLDRERAFYPPVLIVIATYYVLFAVMASSNRALLLEIVAATSFLLLAAIGYKTNPWLLVIGIVGHGVFDGVHHLLIENPGMPRWWPAFCGTFDVVFGILLAARLYKHNLATR